MIHNYYPLIIISLLPHKIRVTSFKAHGESLDLRQGVQCLHLPRGRQRGVQQWFVQQHVAPRCRQRHVAGLFWVKKSPEFHGFCTCFGDVLMEFDGFCWFLGIFLWNLMFVFLSFRVFLPELLINNVQGYLWILMDLCCNNMCLFNCYVWMMKIVDLT